MLTRLAAVALAFSIVGCQSPEAVDYEAIDVDAAMATFMANAQPGAGHALLEPMVGTFNVTMTLYTAPGAPPEVSEGTCTNAWILGGRYIATNFESMAMGQPFSGRGFMGYDNAAGEFSAVWMDSMGTRMSSVARGTASPDGKTITVTMTGPDPIMGTPMMMREVTTIHSHDHHTFQMFETPVGSDEERLSFSIEYHRM